MKPILEIQNISKKFRIYHERQPYLSLRDAISNIFHPAHNNAEDFYALKDVSFDVFPGESIGIIGKNGAGKSTLLKILSKITPPTSGKIISRGRIASLLEVGTGFHGELSGRENIFLNGSILGMKRAEIQKNFDEIVDFSGVEKFLDTPLKHYSSGMQLRLAFAVAAFLKNEILIIDEVLAVGDAEFQKKCLGKMDEVSRDEGRTILFVSHNLAAVSSLCPRMILLQKGHIEEDSNSQDVINKYVYQNKNSHSFDNVINNIKLTYFSSAKLLSSNIEKYEFYFDEEITLKLKIGINKKLRKNLLAVVLANNYNNRISVLFNDISDLKEGIWEIKLILPSKIIAPGFYYFNLFLYYPNDQIFDSVDNICSFQIIDNGILNSQYFHGDYGNFILQAQWIF